MEVSGHNFGGSGCSSSRINSSVMLLRKTPEVSSLFLMLHIG